MKKTCEEHHHLNSKVNENFIHEELEKAQTKDINITQLKKFL